jgi:hypothetical protein
VGQTTAGGAVEPPLNTAFPTYHGIPMLSYLGHHPDDSMLETKSSNPLVSVHAVRHRDGRISVMLVNKDPAVRYNVNVSLAGASSRGWANVHRYGVGSSAIAETHMPVGGATFNITAEPYSLTTVGLP